MRTWWRVVVAAMGCVLLLPTSATASAPAGSTGRDVSYPQCTSNGASTSTVSGLSGAFGIVGVTGGRPWGSNSCLSSEYLWAAGLANAPALYVNTANPAPTSSFFWPTSGSSTPALCKDASSTTDPGCAYDYGWHAAQDALLTQARNVPNAASLSWWLDIETANSWNGDGISNAADLQGMTDYLRSHGVPRVGLYSTGAQWAGITGGYNLSTAASYAAAWQPEFTASYPMTDAPIWVAGLGSSADASALCGTSFAGGPTQLGQYADGSGYDADLVCGTPVAAAPSAPQNLSGFGGDGTVALSWSPPASSGVSSVTYTVSRSTTSGAEIPVVGGLTATTFSDTGLTNGTTYYYWVTANNVTGTSAVSNEVTAVPNPHRRPSRSR